jgi:hypothetical protein
MGTYCSIATRLSNNTVTEIVKILSVLNLYRLRKSWMRKTFKISRGRVFFAGGWGRYGPYAVGTHRIGRKTTVKATAGTKGVTVGAKYRYNRRPSFEGQYNITTLRPSFSIKYRKRKLSLLI